MSARLGQVIDLLTEAADVAVEHARHAELLRQAGQAYGAAVAHRDGRAELLLTFEQRATVLTKAQRKRVLASIALILREQVQFDDACLDVLHRRKS